MCIGRAPRSIIVDKMLPVVDSTLSTLKAHEKNPSKYEGKARGYWEDLLLASFLRGVCLRYVAYPVRFDAI